MSAEVAYPFDKPVDVPRKVTMTVRDGLIRLPIPDDCGDLSFSATEAIEFASALIGLARRYDVRAIR